MGFGVCQISLLHADHTTFKQYYGQEKSPVIPGAQYGAAFGVLKIIFFLLRFSIMARRWLRICGCRLFSPMQKADKKLKVRSSRLKGERHKV
jgi:hypothetical protein